MRYTYLVILMEVVITIKFSALELNICILTFNNLLALVLQCRMHYCQNKCDGGTVTLIVFFATTSREVSSYKCFKPLFFY